MIKKYFSNLLSNYIKKHPLQRGPLLYLFKSTHPIFVDYPVKPKPRYGYGNPPHKELYHIINENRKIYKENLTHFLKYTNYLIKIPKNEVKNRIMPSWKNGYVEGLDSVAIYCFLSKLNPKRYFEIGSGNSTKFARLAISDQNLQTKITSFDPYPREEIDLICDKIFRKPIEEVNLNIFDELKVNDILFVDNSHCSFMNSDVSVTFLDILPRLKSGVIVEFHDIFLPLDYPNEWAGMYYSEQYLLGAYLLANPEKFEIILPNAFICNDPELKNILSPLWNDPKLSGIDNHGISFWMKIR